MRPAALKMRQDLRDIAEQGSHRIKHVLYFREIVQSVIQIRRRLGDGNLIRLHLGRNTAQLGV